MSLAQWVWREDFSQPSPKRQPIRPARTLERLPPTGDIIYDSPDILNEEPMAFPAQPKINLTNTPDFRESYANSVQIHVSVWDFLLTFGRLQAQTPELVEVANFQNIYLSPQQAKALLMILQQNVENYEKAFGAIKLDPQMVPGTVN